jgi:phospholipid/cholesterol/gamma-HCH transport system permease protein
LILAGKVGSSIASELGTMRVTEQIDALEIMGVNSGSFLVLPKIIAALFINPFLVIISMFIGITGGWIFGVLAGVVSTTEFVYGLQSFFQPFYITYALIKTVVFAFLITSISSYFGYYAQGGALEVGSSSTKAVVYSSIFVLVLNYLLTQVLLS